MKLPTTAPSQTKSLKTSSLYRSVNCWSLLIKTSQEALKEPESPGPQMSHPPSLLPYILLSQHSPDYQWPLKLLQGHSQRALPNKISLSSFPNHLTNPEDLIDPYLLEPVDSEPQTPMKLESGPPSSMLFTDASNTLKEGDPQIMKTPKMEEANLPIMSPMEQISRTTSLSPLPMTSDLWDPFHTSSMETEPEQKHFLPNTLDTSC